VSAALSASSYARDYAAIAEDYVSRVRSGTELACKWVRLACERHWREQIKTDWDYVWTPDAGEDVCDFIEKLPHVEGVWKSRTIRLEPPQIFMLMVIFGWRRKVDGLRRFNSVYIEMARKGAKSTLTAGVALYCLCCENEPGAQVIIGATTGEQAKKVFGPAKAMVEKTPLLQQAFGVKAWARSITCADNGGFIQPINAKGSTQDGWNPHVSILDELHAHADRGLFDVVSSAFGARRSPLRWVITTAGTNLSGVCYEQREYVAKVLDGVVTADHYFGIIFTIDDADDPYDEAVWKKANPMLGVTPTLQSMRNEAADAKASPSSEGEFLTKRLNKWLNAASAWLSMTSWQSCADPSLSWDDFDGLDCWIGGDLADKDDITAVVLAAFDEGGRLIFKPRFYLPEAVLRDEKACRLAPYRAWHQRGLLTLTEGDWVDHRRVEADIRQWAERYGVRRAVFDQFAAAQAMVVRLNEEVAAPDGGSFAEVLHKSAPNVTDPAKELEARVRAGPSRLRHDGNEIMTWMASNVVVSKRIDGTILPKKPSQDSAMKIDGIDALVNALKPAMVTQDDTNDIEAMLRFDMLSA
jgi:phage terminase large subunit-like protein